MSDTSDSGISLSIRLPLILDPSERAPGKVIVRVYDTDTGKLIVNRILGDEEMDQKVFVAGVETMPASTLVCAWDGDNGTLMRTAVISAAVMKLDGLPDDLRQALDEAQGDPDQPCPICDDDVPPGADFDRFAAHRECLLANILGPTVRTVVDPEGKLSIRDAARQLYADVQKYGLGRLMVSPN